MNKDPIASGEPRPYLILQALRLLFLKIIPGSAWGFVRKKTVLPFAGLYVPLKKGEYIKNIQIFLANGLELFAIQFGKARLEFRGKVVRHSVLGRKRKGGPVFDNHRVV